MRSKTYRLSFLLATFCMILIFPLSACTLPSEGQSPGEQSTQTPRAEQGHYAVLFDDAHAETAGNADWIISISMPDPLQENANPRTEQDWTGGLSAWGVALQRTGRYTLKTNRQAFTYGNQSNPLDLSKFNTLVIPEPNTRFSASEKTALLNFVQAGGGLFMIADHTGSDRNNDGYDSPQIFNDLMTNNSVANNPFSLQFDKTDIKNENPANVSSNPAATPLLNGPFGPVHGSIIRDGTTIRLSPTNNASALGVIYRNGVSNSGNSAVFLALSSYGKGRIVAIGDSSPIDDGTCSPNNRCYDGWNDPAGQDAALFLNATEWLASGK